MYHKTLEIDIIASNCSNEKERMDLLNKYKILNNSSYFFEVYSRKLDLFGEENVYLAIVDIISSYNLTSDEIKILIRKDFINKNILFEIEKEMKKMNFLKDEFEFTGKKIIYTKTELF